MTREVPPDLADVVRRFEDRMGDVRTRLMRLRAEHRADEARPAEQREPDPDDDYDYFDFDHPVTSSVW